MATQNGSNICFFLTTLYIIMTGWLSSSEDGICHLQRRRFRIQYGLHDIEQAPSTKRI